MLELAVEFLEKLGINSVADLPPLAEFMPGADVVETLEKGLRIDIDEELRQLAAPTDDGAAPAAE